jgi:hypothetical protein
MIGSGRRGHWIAVLTVMGLGCGRDGGISNNGVAAVRAALTTAPTFTLPLFVGENPTDVGLAASSSLSVNDRAVVLELASTSDRGMVSNIGTADLSTVVGMDASVGTVLSQGQVFLRLDAGISGSLYQGGNATAPQTQGSFFVSGITKTRIAGFATDTTWNRTVVWPTTFNTSPNLEPGVIPPDVQLATGAYHTLDLKTGRTLIFNPGEYFLDGLIVEPGAFLDIEASPGPVFIYILDGGLIYRGTMKPGKSTPGMPVPSLTVMTSGSVDIEQPFTGVVIAPNGVIDLKANVNTNDPKSHQGAFFGKNVTLFEGNRVFHYRDPFSFRGFGPNDGTPFIGDRASVTGGSIRIPTKDATDEAVQSESATVISETGILSHVVTVGYNDFTTTPPPAAPTVQYTQPTPPAPPILDPRDSQNRTVFPGTSVMGWSYSTDDGHTFKYGGRVVPPAGVFIWSDPAMAKSEIDDPFVFFAMISGALAAPNKFVTNGLVGGQPDEQDLKNALNGYCIARSTDFGVSFPSVKCVGKGFQDGTALAVGSDSSGHEQVFVTGTQAQIWQMDGNTMTFADNALPNPFPAANNVTHPRMKVNNGVLFIVQTRDDKASPNTRQAIVANRYQISTKTWLGESILAPDPGGEMLSVAPGITVAQGPPFAFDFGTGTSGQPKFRLAYIVNNRVRDAQFNFFFADVGIRVIECDPTTLDPASCQTVACEPSTLDPTTCHFPLTTAIPPGTFDVYASPSLRFSDSFAGSWAVSWRKLDVGTPGKLRAVAGRVNAGSIDVRTIYPGIAPCLVGLPGDGRWGEYDIMDAFGDGRFFVGYTLNGPGCRWQGLWTADSHVGGSVFGF